jgi:hypothetical protein
LDCCAPRNESSVRELQNADIDSNADTDNSVSEYFDRLFD